ncbi:hypothetical protein CMI37_02680 [Candidatus Pacearchaeota archaeon]|nr:hypothetical protein [Candidatus Pacearchaeota archaeon]
MVEGYLDGVQLRKLLLGIYLKRPTAAHVGATTPYFTIVGGSVLLTSLVGTVVTESGANACSWVANPTLGTAQSVCGNLDINPALVGDSLTITGVGNAAMTYNGSATGLAVMTTKVVLNIGNLAFIAAAGDGSTSWVVTYIPLDDGAYMAVV